MDSQTIIFLIFGLVLSVSGVSIIIWLGERATLECYRLTANQVTCTLKQSTLRNTITRSLEKNQLQGAEVVRHRDSDGDSVYRLELLTDSGRIPLTQLKSSDRRGKRRKAEIINGFLSNPEQQTLKIVQDDRWFALLLGGGLTAAGLRLLIGALEALSRQ